ncbi:MAG TPA: hypothetical protein PKZ84_04445 [Anaerolineae bacterium]|nr:hypothetical protein [Anaerolineae bacterium]HQI83817.1 hypothetical protein [Anaerolineae bacterium]
METQTHIVICGHSLYLDAIAMMVQGAPGVVMTQVHERAGMVERIAALEPDVLIIERGAFDMALLWALSTCLVGVPVIEVHTRRSVLTVHTTWETPVRGMEHLAQVLEHIAPPTKLPYSCDETQTLGVGL